MQWIFALRKAVEIQQDDLSGAAIRELLEEHLRCMAAASPAESRHALDLAGLRRPEITFWSVWNGAVLAGCGALLALDETEGEIKSMRTAYAFQRKGVATQMLRHILAEAARRGYRWVSLETGSMDYFAPARKLYAQAGFVRCGPFGRYKEDPNSTFMTKALL